MNRNTFEPSQPADVECQTAGELWTLVFVRNLRHSPERVWAALTEPAQLREWAPYTASRDLGSAGEATLTMIDGDVAEDLPATVTRAEHPRLLEYEWGTDLLRWELAATAYGTTLTLRHTIKDRDAAPKAAAGWHLCLDVAELLLDGQPVGPIRGSEALQFGWGRLNEAYAAKLGIPATDPPTDT
ncbi:MAG: SRPBCC family protein [Nocardioidaceae bacterium]